MVDINPDSTCSKHLILSPGVMMAVVNTPASMPALKYWKYLQQPGHKHSVLHMARLHLLEAPNRFTYSQRIFYTCN